ncbi:MAG: hypothetical protein WA667_14575 [Candidatus Nitrosopolaris sp.]
MYINTMNSKTTMAFSTMTIAVLVLLFASGPIVGNQQASAANLAGSGLVHYHHYHHYHYGHYRR